MSSIRFNNLRIPHSFDDISSGFDISSEILDSFDSSQPLAVSTLALSITESALEIPVADATVFVPAGSTFPVTNKYGLFYVHIGSEIILIDGVSNEGPDNRGTLHVATYSPDNGRGCLDSDAADHERGALVQLLVSSGSHTLITSSLSKIQTELLDIFNYTTGHDHSGSMKGAQIPTAGLQNNAITAQKIATNAVTPSKLLTTNSPTDDYFLKYNAATQKFKWSVGGVVGFDSTSINDTTWGDATEATITWTYDVSVGTNPYLSFSDETVQIGAASTILTNLLAGFVASPGSLVISDGGNPTATALTLTYGGTQDYSLIFPTGQSAANDNITVCSTGGQLAFKSAATLGLYKSGGTDVALADGGTGASLVDPDADKIMFWDDSASSVAWLAIGTGLSISGGTTLTANGTVTGSGTENHIAKFNSVGTGIQDSPWIIEDIDVMEGVLYAEYATASITFTPNYGAGAFKTPLTTDPAIDILVNGESDQRLRILGSGTFKLGSGSLSQDVELARLAANLWGMGAGDAFVIQGGASEHASTTDGTLYYRTDTDILQLRANGAWVNIATGSGSGWDGTTALQTTNGASIDSGLVAADTFKLRGRAVDSVTWIDMLTVTSAALAPTLDFPTGATWNSNYIYHAGGTDVPVTDGGTGLSTFGGTNTLLYTSSADILTSITTANSSVLVTSGAGAPSWATDIPTAVTIGGAYVHRVGGTDVALADGGTGASLADPNADRIMFWDDSAGAVTWLTVGTNLTITDTTISASGGSGWDGTVDLQTSNGVSIDSGTTASDTFSLRGRATVGGTWVDMLTVTSAALAPTLDFPTGATWNSNYIYHETGTDVALTDGGTGASTAAGALLNISGWTLAAVSSANFTTTSTTLVDITGLTFAASANTLYEFEILLKVNSSSGTAGIKYGLQYSAAGASLVANVIGTSNAITAASNSGLGAFNTETANTFVTASGLTGYCIMKGFLTVGANAGNFTVQILKVTSQTATVYIGSMLKVRVAGV